METIEKIFNILKHKISNIFTPNDGKTEDTFNDINLSTLQIIYTTIFFIFIFIIFILVLRQIYYNIKFCLENPLDATCRQQIKIRIGRKRSHRNHHCHHCHHGHYGHHVHHAYHG